MLISEDHHQTILLTFSRIQFIRNSAATLHSFARAVCAKLFGDAPGAIDRFQTDKSDPSVIVFSEIKRCQLPHSTHFFQKAKIIIAEEKEKPKEEKEKSRKERKREKEKEKEKDKSGKEKSREREKERKKEKKDKGKSSEKREKKEKKSKEDKDKLIWRPKSTD